MTVDDCRVILKAHITGAEYVGKREAAMALLEALQAIDDQISYADSLDAPNKAVYPLI